MATVGPAPFRATSRCALPGATQTRGLSQARLPAPRGVLFSKRSWIIESQPIYAAT